LSHFVVSCENRRKIPHEDEVTDYDREHIATYLRLLDADAEGTDCRPERDAGRRRSFG
jgi:hypothetical protein